MDAESGMVEQAARLVAANPAQKVGVYRNIIAAQPWFPSVAAKLRDPQYSGWFLLLLLVVPHNVHCFA